MARSRFAEIAAALWCGVGDADSRSAMGGVALATVSDQGLEQRDLAVSSDPDGVAFLLTAAANISKFNVIIAIVLHAFFNTSSRLGNALTQNLARRPNQMMIYTFVVFGGGVVVGLAALWGHGRTPTLQSSNQ
jgi:hypothetical protein